MDDPRRRRLRIDVLTALDAFVGGKWDLARFRSVLRGAEADYRQFDAALAAMVRDLLEACDSLDPALVGRRQRFEIQMASDPLRLALHG